jgi:hypothetical protein
VEQHPPTHVSHGRRPVVDEDTTKVRLIWFKFLVSDRRRWTLVVQTKNEKMRLDSKTKLRNAYQ